MSFKREICEDSISDLLVQFYRDTPLNKHLACACLPAHPLPAVQIFGFSPALAAWVNRPYVNQCCFHLKTKFFLLL